MDFNVQDSQARPSMNQSSAHLGGTSLRVRALRFAVFHLSAAALLATALPNHAAEPPRQFNVWAVSCAHVPADIRKGRESLAKPIRQSEGREPGAPAFDWDIMLDAGDVSAHQRPPEDKDGIELIRQYRAMRDHRREQVYNVPGNHDAPYYDLGPGSWIRKWGDPLGENTEFSGVDPKRRPFPVEGTWERYKFLAGNLLVLMLADRNDAPEPVGRGHSRDGKSGGFPPGAVTRDTFNWWKKQVLENQDKIIVTMHHHALRDTTTASGNGEGNPRYHGSTGGAAGSSYLYFIIENDDPENFQYTADAHVFEDFLDEFRRKNGRGAIDLWLGGHTHVKGPNDNWGDKTISERKWGVGFFQVAALTRHHGGSLPLSRVISFTDGSDRLAANVYLHEDWFESNPIGFYKPAAIDWPLRHKFQAPPPIKKMPPFPKAAKVFNEKYPTAGRTPEKAAYKAGPSPDLTGRWDAKSGGSFQLEAQLRKDARDEIDNKPRLIAEGPGGTAGQSMEFDGSQRLRVGSIDMDDWTDLTVCAWIATKNNTPQMRIISKDRVGKPGLFQFLHRNIGEWGFQAWDDKANTWRAATVRSDAVSDGQWHHLAGVVDSKRGNVLLYIDGEQTAEAPWTAKTLDDSEHTDLVIGAGSGEKTFGHTFRGSIHDPQVYPRALSPSEIANLWKRR